MKNIDLLKLFIKNDNSIVCSYDNNKKIISEIIYYHDDIEKEEKNFSKEDFFSFLNNFYNVNIDYLPIVETIFMMLDGNDFFDFPYIINTIDKKVLKLRIKGGKFEENIMFAILVDNYEIKTSIDELTKCNSLDILKKYTDDLLKIKEEFIFGMIDIDNFKDINSKYGDIYGDIILIEITKILKDILKSNAMLSRIGGDTFAFCYKIKNNYENIREFLLSLKLKIKEELNKNLNVEPKITTTIGASRAYVDGDDFNSLYNKAFKALERGKKKSRDCFIIYFKEKCGEIDNFKRIEKLEIENKKTANYSGITGVIDILNSNMPFRKSIEEAMSLIGTFLMLDRLSIIELDQVSGKIKNAIKWENPISPKYDIYFQNDMIEHFRKILGESNLFIFENVLNIENNLIKEECKKSHIYAMISSEIKINGKKFGLIQYEMTSHTRRWQKDDIMAINLLTKIISTKYNKEYEAYIHFRQMYFDVETELFNLHKWYEDVNLILEENKKTNAIEKYTIFDIGIMKFSTLVSVAGIKYVRKALRTIADSLKGLELNGIKYCRSYENRFTLFIPFENKEFIKNIFDKILNNLSILKGTYGEKVNIRSGYYVVDVKNNYLEFDEILDRAITARKKANSINNILEFDEEMLVVDKFKTMLVSHIDQALENNEFILYLQPKISTKTGSVAGAEALSRWDYNFEKILFPNEFIPLLETNGYISKLDYKVFENVCKFIKKLEDEGKNIIPISVNVSRSIKDFNIYFETLEAIRKKYNVRADLIEIEITEGMYSHDNIAIEEFIHKLHDVGYKVSMDDFGSGNSNISTLSQLNFDTIKFDKGFFNDIDNIKERMIVDSMTKLVKGMNMNVVCEGIETEEYVKYLTEIGADYIQGYYFDKPINIDSFENKYIN